ncbi:P-loop containing nucleoside triphosphate hydrolase protein [Coccomyxa subellipsoidea C-169]|uniref:P-loop containing nucleoside triphosphate hydrolase protein n=1 Tax=Coccomyxa subellipsoidea (strain C-169) TaxID=574566 RepID=I0Z316_COCSC|nr:P-loop containing nucleoside triphosphate hydrolase protein [Coccomyxa subellipsoidea C-169]EIE25035.1 P-loop containing nucleoside triphosphate hydrolase protein [Coccomyxa subellipsoidea C-169]|eukprot:XP_005649579.1 P-loop containing nucleoside triphosphate hydrolase protein [Coccomyxa subellipsoidea C-169]
MSTELSQSSEMTHSQRRLNTVLAGPDPESPRRALSERPSYAIVPEHKVTIEQADAAVDLLEPIKDENRMCVEYTHVSANVPASFAAPGIFPGLSLPKFGKKAKQESGPKMRRILYDITGCCKPGEVLALMGPSGSGKTSLLSIIGDRAQSHMKREGTITFNGEPATKGLKRHIGFVMQDDLLYESLTVWEVLYYAAMLRLPRTMSHEAKKERVATVIRALGIWTCRDTIIGGFFRKGISGGERKRVSIGHELLINPSVLLLDEPTSGLDSTTAMHVLEILRQLAEGGRAIITTIHQPSSRLFQTLDKLLLLSQGHALYYGRAQLADEYFDRLGYQLPYRVNVADFILDLASADFLIRASERYLARHTIDGYSGGDTAGAELAAARDYAADESADAAASKDGKGSFRILFIRAVRTRRFQTLSAQDIIQYVIVGLLTGCFWWQRGGHDTLAASQDTLALVCGAAAGLLFFELMFLTFRSMFTALFTFPEEYKMLLKERASGMYRLSAFYFARTASDLPMDFAVPTIFIVIIYFMAHLRYTAEAFFGNFFTVILMGLVAQGFGLLLGTVCMNPKTAQTIASIVVLAFTLVGGYFVRGIPAWIGWIRYLSFIYYGFGMLLHIEYQGRTIYSCVDPNTAASSGAMSVQVRLLILCYSLLFLQVGEPKARGHRAYTSAATSAGPTAACSLVVIHILMSLEFQVLGHSFCVLYVHALLSEPE